MAYIDLGPGDILGPNHGHRNDPRNDPDDGETPEDRASSYMTDGEKLDEIVGDLATFSTKAYRAALVLLMVSNDAEPLRTLIQTRAEKLAEDELDDEADDARREAEDLSDFLASHECSSAAY